MGIPECYVNERLVWTYKISRSNDSRRGKLSQPCDDSVAWLLAQEERHKFRFRRCVVLWGTLAVNTEHVQQQWVTTSSCGLLISCDMIVIRSAVVFVLFFSGEQKSNNIVVYYSRYVVVETWYKNKTIIVK